MKHSKQQVSAVHYAIFITLMTVLFFSTAFFIFAMSTYPPSAPGPQTFWGNPIVVAICTLLAFPFIMMMLLPLYESIFYHRYTGQSRGQDWLYSALFISFIVDIVFVFSYNTSSSLLQSMIGLVILQAITPLAIAFSRMD
ncbi:hypothetical protein IPM09_02975 [Candidatus Saccharibacteria bacterium]|nr:MAG: hypothetical protein IPM09_02975 [Candidatus Saccharibacteria bacterium]